MVPCEYGFGKPVAFWRVVEDKLSPSHPFPEQVFHPFFPAKLQHLHQENLLIFHNQTL